MKTGDFHTPCQKQIHKCNGENPIFRYSYSSGNCNNICLKFPFLKVLLEVNGQNLHIYKELWGGMGPHIPALKGGIWTWWKIVRHDRAKNGGGAGLNYVGSQWYFWASGKMKSRTDLFLPPHEKDRSGHIGMWLVSTSWRTVAWPLSKGSWSVWGTSPLRGKLQGQINQVCSSTRTRDWHQHCICFLRPP